MTLTQIRNMSREEIVNLARVEILKHDAHFDPADFDRIRVLGNKQRIVVDFAMSVRFFPIRRSSQDLFHLLRVTFTEQSRVVEPSPKEIFKPTATSKKIVAAIAAAGIFNREDDSAEATIEEESTLYTVTVSHRPKEGWLSGGAESYRLDKSSEKIEMLWHESPMHNTSTTIEEISDDEDELRELR